MRLKRSFASYENITCNGNKKADCFVCTLDKDMLNCIESDPKKVAKHDNIYCKFLCDNCFHYFILKACHVVVENKWCPICTLNMECSIANCVYCEKNATLSRLLNNKNSFFIGLKLNKKVKVIDPSTLYINSISMSLLVFQCNECMHVYETSLFNFLMNKKCIYCKKNELLCDDKWCKHCFKKSFASFDGTTRSNKMKNTFLVGYYENQKFVHENNPRNIPIYLNKKLKFYCYVCKKNFEITLFKITERNKWCQDCMHLTELILHKWLLNNYKDENLIREFSEKWTENKKYDYCFPDWKILIELDGPHHFIKVNNGKCPLKTQKNDRVKDSIAINNGYSIIRVSQQDVIKNKNKWWHFLKYYILLCKNSSFTQRIMLYNLEEQIHENPLTD